MKLDHLKAAAGVVAVLRRICFGVGTGPRWAWSARSHGTLKAQLALCQLMIESNTWQAPSAGQESPRQGLAQAA
jgi:hypothetical protein